MKTCPNCHASIMDDAVFCTNCGTPLNAAPQPAPQQEAQPQQPQQPQQQPVQQPAPQQQALQPQPAPQQQSYQQPPYQQQPVQQPTEPKVNIYDHTAEFSEEEVHDNKIFALTIYALSFIGIIIALLAKSSDNSSYLRFHIKQMLMILITETLVGFITGILCWTCIVPIAGGALLAFLFIVQIICFINVCRNKSIEPLLVRKLGFLK